MRPPCCIDLRFQPPTATRHVQTRSVSASPGKFLKNHERARKTERSREREGALEALGSISQRAPMGNRARRLQSERNGLGLFYPRSCSQSRLSLGRGRYLRI